MSREWKAKFVGTERDDTFHPVIFKDFYLDDPVLKATLYITSAGLFEAYINGRRVGDEYLTPYRNTLSAGAQYYTFDITNYLNCGPNSDSNSVDIFLGKGWDNDVLGNRLAVKAELVIEVEKTRPAGVLPEEGQSVQGETGGTYSDPSNELNKDLLPEDNSMFLNDGFVSEDPDLLKEEAGENVLFFVMEGSTKTDDDPDHEIDSDLSDEIDLEWIEENELELMRKSNTERMAEAVAKPMVDLGMGSNEAAETELSDEIEIAWTEEDEAELLKEVEAELANNPDADWMDEAEEDLPDELIEEWTADIGEAIPNEAVEEWTDDIDDELQGEPELPAENNVVWTEEDEAELLKEVEAELTDQINEGWAEDADAELTDNIESEWLDDETELSDEVATDLMDKVGAELMGEVEAEWNAQEEASAFEEPVGEEIADAKEESIEVEGAIPSFFATPEISGVTTPAVEDGVESEPELTEEELFDAIAVNLEEAEEPRAEAETEQTEEVPAFAAFDEPEAEPETEQTEEVPAFAAFDEPEAELETEQTEEVPAFAAFDEPEAEPETERIEEVPAFDAFVETETEQTEETPEEAPAVDASEWETQEEPAADESVFVAGYGSTPEYTEETAPAFASDLEEEPELTDEELIDAIAADLEGTEETFEEEQTETANAVPNFVLAPELSDTASPAFDTDLEEEPELTDEELIDAISTDLEGTEETFEEEQTETADAVPNFVLAPELSDTTAPAFDAAEWETQEEPVADESVFIAGYGSTPEFAEETAPAFASDLEAEPELTEEELIEAISADLDETEEMEPEPTGETIPAFMGAFEETEETPDQSEATIPFAAAGLAAVPFIASGLADTSEAVEEVTEEKVTEEKDTEAEETLAAEAPVEFEETAEAEELEEEAVQETAEAEPEEAEAYSEETVPSFTAGFETTSEEEIPVEEAPEETEAEAEAEILEEIKEEDAVPEGTEEEAIPEEVIEEEVAPEEILAEEEPEEEIAEEVAEKEESVDEVPEETEAEEEIFEEATEEEETPEAEAPTEFEESTAEEEPEAEEAEQEVAEETFPAFAAFETTSEEAIPVDEVPEETEAEEEISEETTEEEAAVEEAASEEILEEETEAEEEISEEITAEEVTAEEETLEEAVPTDFDEIAAAEDIEAEEAYQEAAEAAPEVTEEFEAAEAAPEVTEEFEAAEAAPDLTKAAVPLAAAGLAAAPFVAAGLSGFGTEPESAEETVTEEIPEAEPFPAEETAAAEISEAEPLPAETVAAGIAEAEPVETETYTETIIIGTDETWGYYGSDIEMNDLSKGEVFNRLLWDEKENPEKNVVVLDIDVPLVERTSLPIKIQEFHPVKEIIYAKDGIPILDFGQQFTGFVTFDSMLPKGTEVKLTFADERNEDGTLSGGGGSFTYVSDGTPETVSPHFAYLTGRYVKVEGFGEDLKAEDFTACLLYAVMEQTGFIETGNQTANQLFADVLTGQKNDSVMIPETRTELDVSLFVPVACYNMNAEEFLKDYLRSLRTKEGFASRNAASIIWNLYRMFGDKSILEENYDLLKDFTDRMLEMKSGKDETFLFKPAQRKPSAVTGEDGTFTCSAAVYYNAKLISLAAKELEKEQEEFYYERLARKIRQAIMEEYFTLTGRFALDAQYAYATALRLGLYVEKDRMVEAFRKRIEIDGNKICCKEPEASWIGHVLTDCGLSELAYELMLKGEGKRGTGTAWFLYAYTAGIKPLEPGFSEVEIAPVPDRSIGFCHASYRTKYGPIVSNWDLQENGALNFHIEIPEGITAKIVLPHYPVCAAGSNEMTVGSGSYDYAYVPQPAY